MAILHHNVHNTPGIIKLDMPSHTYVKSGRDIRDIICGIIYQMILILRSPCMRHEGPSGGGTGRGCPSPPPQIEENGDQKMLR